MAFKMQGVSLGKPNTAIPIVGAIVGTTHMKGGYLLTDGRSLHPLQRSGAAAHSGYPSVGVPPLAGSGGPPAAQTDISYPARLTPTIAGNPSVMIG